MMTVLQPPDWARPKGFSHGIAVKGGTTVYIAGQVGCDAQGKFQEKSFAGQFRRTLQNILAVLAQAGGRPEHIARLTWYVHDRQKDYVQDGWNITGDAYVMDMDGYFHYQARTDDMIISAGYNIAGPEVEGALLSHPAVAECGVVGAADEARGPGVKAFVVSRKAFSASEDMKKELQEHVKRSIAPYKYPRKIEFVDGLPRTETGKLQRYKLRTEGR